MKHFYNKYNILFLLKNKFFKYLRKNCRKFKINRIFENFNVIFKINEISKNSLKKFVVFIINNVKIITIVYFIIKLRDEIVKFNYNFRN